MQTKWGGETLSLFTLCRVTRAPLYSGQAQQSKPSLWERKVAKLCAKFSIFPWEIVPGQIGSSPWLSLLHCIQCGGTESVVGGNCSNTREVGTTLQLVRSDWGLTSFSRNTGHLLQLIGLLDEELHLRLYFPYIILHEWVIWVMSGLQGWPCCPGELNYDWGMWGVRSE